MNSVVRFSFCAILPSLMPASARSQQPIVEYVNPASYRIRHTAEVRNHDVTKIKSLELNLPVPEDWPEQGISNLRIKGIRPFTLLNTEGAGRIVRSYCHYRGEPVPRAGERRWLSVDYALVSKEVRTDKKQLETMKLSPYAKRKQEYRYYTRSEKLIEADDSGIVAVADRLRKQTDGPYRFARAAYEFVLDHVEYVTPTPAWGAKACLENGKGDCGQYAALFVAICRAGGIPARPVAGCWATGKNRWHCWAEFQLPGVGWLPVDPTSGRHDESKRDYYFCNLDNNRLAFVKAFNMVFKASRGSQRLGFLQVGCWFWHRQPGSLGSNIQPEFVLVGEHVD